MAVEAVADQIVRHRQPTIRFVRLPDVEPGSQVSVYWNGSKAANGDGLPGGNGALSYTTAIAGPMLIWLSGHPTLFGGGFGLGGFGEPGAAFDPSMGFGNGPFGVGAFGIGGGYWEWTFPFRLRDGIYKIAIRILDWLGNERTVPDQTLTLAVEAIPRPTTGARLVGYDGPALEVNIDWRPSPDLLSA